MKPLEINNKWYIEECTEEFGNILLLDKTKKIKPLQFDTLEECLDYIKSLQTDFCKHEVN